MSWNPLELRLEASSRVPEVVGLLQAEPQLRSVTAEFSESDGHVRRDRRGGRENPVQRLAAHAQLACGRTDCQVQGRQNILAQHLARMERGRLERPPHPVFTSHKTLQSRRESCAWRSGRQ